MASQKNPFYPAVLRQAKQSQPELRAFFQNFTVAFLVIVGLFYSFVGLSDSWIKTSLIAISLVIGALWLVSHRKIRKIGRRSKIYVSVDHDFYDKLYSG